MPPMSQESTPDDSGQSDFIRCLMISPGHFASHSAARVPYPGHSADSVSFPGHSADRVSFPGYSADSVNYCGRWANGVSYPGHGVSTDRFAAPGSRQGQIVRSRLGCAVVLRTRSGSCSARPPRKATFDVP